MKYKLKFLTVIIQALRWFKAKSNSEGRGSGRYPESEKRESGTAGRTGTAVFRFG